MFSKEKLIKISKQVESEHFATPQKFIQKLPIFKTEAAIQNYEKFEIVNKKLKFYDLFTTFLIKQANRNIYVKKNTSL